MNDIFFLYTFNIPKLYNFQLLCQRKFNKYLNSVAKLFFYDLNSLELVYRRCTYITYTNINATIQHTYGMKLNFHLKFFVAATYGNNVNMKLNCMVDIQCECFSDEFNCYTCKCSNGLWLCHGELTSVHFFFARKKEFVL